MEKTFRSIVKEFISSKGLEVDSKDSTERMYNIAVYNGFDVSTVDTNLLPSFVHVTEGYKDETEETEADEAENEAEETEENEVEETEENEAEETEENEAEETEENEAEEIETPIVIKKPRKKRLKKIISQNPEKKEPEKKEPENKDNSWLWMLVAAVIAAAIYFLTNKKTSDE